MLSKRDKILFSIFFLHLSTSLSNLGLKIKSSKNFIDSSFIPSSVYFSFKNLIATLLGTAPKNLLEEVNNSNLEKKLEFKAGLNKQVEGIIVGGNLSLVASMMGTPYEIDTKDKIFALGQYLGTFTRLFGY